MKVFGGRTVSGRRLPSLAAFFLAFAWQLLPAAEAAATAGKLPVLIGFDAEFGHNSSGSADAIKQGILLAIDEVNRRGGVLGGRPLQLVERANHAVPARSIRNLRELAGMPDLVAIFCGRFSPTVLEGIPLVHQLGVPLLDPWAAADAIIDNGYQPNFAFRLALKDSWAADAMLDHLAAKGVRRVGLLMLNSSWGRSNKKAAEDYVARKRRLSIVDTQWMNWDDKEDSMSTKYQALRAKGAQGLLITANAEEASVLAKVMLSRPKEERLPIASHWGVTGGDLPGMVGRDFFKLDFAVVQTYSFIDSKSKANARIVAAHNRKFGSKGARGILSPVGVAHAYDLTHLLAMAIDRAGSSDRKAIRSALEHLGPYDGLMRRFSRPFSPTRHEALDRKDLFMTRYAERDGVLERISGR